MTWDKSPAGREYHRNYQNEKYRATPRKLKQIHPPHRCTVCDETGHNSRRHLNTERA